MASLCKYEMNTGRKEVMRRLQNGLTPHACLDNKWPSTGKVPPMITDIDGILMQPSEAINELARRDECDESAAPGRPWQGEAKTRMEELLQRVRAKNGVGVHVS